MKKKLCIRKRSRRRNRSRSPSYSGGVCAVILYKTATTLILKKVWGRFNERVVRTFI